MGIIATGDYHSVPRVFEHGSMCTLVADRTKEAIWEAWRKRRVYGVSQSRIEVDETVNGVPMGGETTAVNGQVELEFSVKGTAAVDSVMKLTIDGKEYPLPVRKLLESSKVFALWDEVKKLTEDTWGALTHYRDDPWWPLKLACPKQCKLSILTMEKAAANLCAKKYDRERVFIVVKGPSTVRRLYDSGFHMEKINVGNMGGKANTRMLKKAVSVSEKDMEDLLYLAQKGVAVTAQMAPTEEAVDLAALIAAKA